MRSNFFAFNRWLSSARWGISFYLLIGLSHQLYAQVCPENHYQWPGGHGTQQIRLNGLFMEYRERQNPHFHDGIDVAIATNNPTVYVSNNSIVLQVNLVNPNNNDWEVRLRELDAPFREFYYYHLNATADSLEVDEILNAGDWVGNVNGFNHLHFCEGPNMAEVNPLTESDYGESLCPFIDTSDPVVWNYRIEYDNTNLPMPKIGNRYQVTGPVDILANCEDRISGPGSTANLGLYAIEYEVKDLPAMSSMTILIYLILGCLHQTSIMFTVRLCPISIIQTQTLILQFIGTSQPITRRLMAIGTRLT